MLDISFSELMLIGVVALVVIGPEKLPKVARTAGLLFGRAQRYIHQVKTEIEREAQFEEIEKMKIEARESMLKLENTLQSKALDFEKQAKELNLSAADEVQALQRAAVGVKSPEADPVAAAAVKPAVESRSVDVRAVPRPAPIIEIVEQDADAVAAAKRHGESRPVDMLAQQKTAPVVDIVEADPRQLTMDFEETPKK